MPVMTQEYVNDLLEYGYGVDYDKHTELDNKPSDRVQGNYQPRYK